MKVIKEHNRTELIRMLPKNAVCAEIGVQAGVFARQILNDTLPKKLHLVDCWQAHENPDTSGRESQAEHDAHYRRVRGMVRQHHLRHNVKIHRGFTAEVTPTFPDGYFDWVYVDAMHTYEGCLADLEMLGPKIKPGGVITGHDYEQGTAWARRVNCGVVEAVQEFCREHGWVMTHLFDDAYRNNSYALRRMGE